MLDKWIQRLKLKDAYKIHIHRLLSFDFLHAHHKDQPPARF